MKNSTESNFIKSPINYTGNKFRILDQIQSFFPKKIKTMVDLCCGGGTVGINTNAKKVIFIDNSKQLINLLKYLYKNNYETVLEKILRCINKYKLSCSFENGFKFYKNKIQEPNSNNGLKKYNSKNYYKLRQDYNSLAKKDTEEAMIMLYVLLVYSFNNDLRFSKNGDFNLPIGKTDFNNVMASKLKKFINSTSKKKYLFICSDFNSKVTLNWLKKADFVYIDPPYLITTATYNETNKWDNETEYNLLRLIDFFIEKNIKFVLSNVLEKKGKRNEPLYFWSESNKKIKCFDIDYNYRSSSYNKIDRDSMEREVIFTNAADTK